MPNFWIIISFEEHLPFMSCLHKLFFSDINYSYQAQEKNPTNHPSPDYDWVLNNEEHSADLTQLLVWHILSDKNDSLGQANYSEMTSTNIVIVGVTLSVFKEMTFNL